MVVVLLAFKKAQIWFLSYWHKKKPRYGCCLVGIFKIKSSDMVVVLLAFLKVKTPNMVVVLLGFLLNMTHVLTVSYYSIKMC